MKKNIKTSHKNNVFFIACGKPMKQSNLHQDSLHDRRNRRCGISMVPLEADSSTDSLLASSESATRFTVKNWHKNNYKRINHFDVDEKCYYLTHESLKEVPIEDGSSFTICLNGHHQYKSNKAYGIRSSANGLFYQNKYIAKLLYDNILKRIKGEKDKTKSSTIPHVDIILFCCNSATYSHHPRESTIYQLAKALKKIQFKDYQETKSIFSFSVKGLFEKCTQEKDGISLQDISRPKIINKTIGKCIDIFFEAYSHSPFSNIKFLGPKQCLLRTQPHDQKERKLYFRPIAKVDSGVSDHLAIIG